MILLHTLHPRTTMTRPLQLFLLQIFTALTAKAHSVSATSSAHLFNTHDSAACCRTSIGAVVASSTHRQESLNIDPGPASLPYRFRAEASESWERLCGPPWWRSVLSDHVGLDEESGCSASIVVSLAFVYGHCVGGWRGWDEAEATTGAGCCIHDSDNAVVAPMGRGGNDGTGAKRAIDPHDTEERVLSAGEATMGAQHDPRPFVATSTQRRQVSASAEREGRDLMDGVASSMPSPQAWMLCAWLIRCRVSRATLSSSGTWTVWSIVVALLMSAPGAAAAYYNFSQRSPSQGDLNDAVREWTSNKTIATAKYGPIEDWDISRVTTLEYVTSARLSPPASQQVQILTHTLLGFAAQPRLIPLNYRAVFKFQGDFNADLSKWNTEGVTDMLYAFEFAGNFNGDISKWNTAGVTKMFFAFRAAGAFNASLSNWDISNVEILGGAFYGAIAFQSDLSKWNTGKVKDFKAVFQDAKRFDSDLSKWNMEHATDLVHVSYVLAPRASERASERALMLTHTILAFAAPPRLLPRDCRNLFLNAKNFNSDLSKWNTERATDLGSLFRGASIFDSDLSKWSLETAVAMSSIFEDTDSLSNCNKDLIANAWGRKNDVGAFKAAYPGWEAWNTFECAPGCAAGFWCNKTAANRSKIKITCDEGVWCPENTESFEDQMKCPNGNYGKPIPDNQVGGFKFQSEACALCGPGLFGTGEGKVGREQGCEQCPDGEWSSFGAPECFLECAVLGTYCELGRGSNDGNCTCRPCPPGTALATLGNTSDAACLPCEGAFVAATNGTANCLQCDPGKQSNGDHTECEACPAGKAREFDQASCTDCTTGSSDEGSSYCDDCKAGTFLNASKSPPTCDMCPHGRVSKAASPNCTKCEAGTWQSGTDCVACPAGYFGNRTGLSNDKCDGACPAGTHSYRYATKCLECEVGKHAPNATMEDCVTCDTAQDLTPSLDATTCLCKAETYRNANGDCTSCPDGAECGSIGNDLATLATKKNYWRSGATSDEILRCPFDGACLGGPNSSCAEGNEGVLCAVCSEGHYRPTGLSACEVCGAQGPSTGIALSIVAAMIVALVVFIFINRRAPNGLLRPFILLVQLFSVMLAFDAPFPKVLVDAGRAMSALNIGFELASPTCAGLSDDYYSTFGATIVTLLLVCAATVAPMPVAKFRGRLTWREALRSDVAGRCFRDLFVIVLLFHPPVSGKAMQFFRCREIGGESYLVADYSIKCYDDAWYAYIVVVVPVLAVFSFGTPIIIAFVLYAHSAQLYDENHTFVPQPLDIIYAIYKESAYWFESVQMIFKLALWSTLVFFGFKSVMQLATALVVNVLQLCVHIYILPMGGEDAALLNTMQTATLLLTVYINFSGLMMNYLEVAEQLALSEDDVSLVESYGRSRRTLGVIMQILTLGIFVGFGVVGANKVYRKAKELSTSELKAKVRMVSVRMSSRFVRKPSSSQDAAATFQGPKDQASPVSLTPNPTIGKVGDDSDDGGVQLSTFQPTAAGRNSAKV